MVINLQGKKFAEWKETQAAEVHARRMEHAEFLKMQRKMQDSSSAEAFREQQELGKVLKQVNSD